MAKVSGPFMSVDASGTIYQALTASIWKGRNYIRGYRIPTNPNTAAQQTQRELMATAVAAWQALTEVKPASGALGDENYKDQWDLAAADCYPPISGFNYYTSQYLLQGSVPTIPAVAPKKSKTIHG